MTDHELESPYVHDRELDEPEPEVGELHECAECGVETNNDSAICRLCEAHHAGQLPFGFKRW